VESGAKEAAAKKKGDGIMKLRNRTTEIMLKMERKSSALSEERPSLTVGKVGS